MSHSLRTDVTALELMVRSPFSNKQLRDRISEILAVPPDRLTLTSAKTQNVLSLDTEVEDKIMALDAWCIPTMHYDIMDVILTGQQPPPAFVFKIQRRWTHEQVLSSLAQIVHKEKQQIFLTDANGRPWTYPHSRLDTTTIVLHVLPQIEKEEAPILYSARGGARTVETTEPYEENGENEQHAENQEATVEQAGFEENGFIDEGENDQEEEHWEEDYRLTRRRRAPRLEGRAARQMTMEAIARYQERMARRSRSRSRGEGRRSPNSIASTEASPEALLRSRALPVSPPPAQPDLLPRPIYDDIGAVGVLEAPPTARVVEVIRDLVEQISVHDLVHVEPICAYMWREVNMLRLPPQYRIRAFQPIDMRRTRWELYQSVRHVPLMANGLVQNTIVLPWHVTINEARYRIERRAPREQYWQLSAITPENWILHRLFLPEAVRNDLEELEELRNRGGMRPGLVTEKLIDLTYHHNSSVVRVVVDDDLTIHGLLRKIGEMNGCWDRDVLLMRGVHIPGLQEIASTYQSLVVYLLDQYRSGAATCKGGFRFLSSARLWQWSKSPCIPWTIGSIAYPIPQGLPVVYGPHPVPPRGACSILDDKTGDKTCIITLAHDHDRKCAVTMKGDACIGDVLLVLQNATGYMTNHMVLLADGKALPPSASVHLLRGQVFLLLGDHLNAVDGCVPSAASWLRREDDEPSLTIDLANADMNRGGARAERPIQQPRAVMIAWAEDKVRRELPTLNPLTVTMLLKAEQRTMSAVLHTRSAAQTREVMAAAYRRAGLRIDQPQPSSPQQQQQAAPVMPTADVANLMQNVDHIMTAIMQQVTITGQIYEAISALPTNADFIRLLETTQAHQQGEADMVERMTSLMQMMNHVRQMVENRADNDMERHMESRSLEEWRDGDGEELP